MLRPNIIIRAWKDCRFRRHLTLEERTQLPQYPAGTMELSAEEMRTIVGAHEYPSSHGPSPNCCHR
jgi:mersacidin/lichenicidin family type 2 lantibiotic